MDLAEVGATPEGGSGRLSFSVEDGQARALVIDWARAAGLMVETDAIGNLFCRWAPPACDPRLPPVLTGSHLDTQPNGGRFDGMFGVLAGLEAVEAIQSSEVSCGRPVEVVVWSNEEGCRFQPGCMGSDAFANASRLDTFFRTRDDEGRSVIEALPEMTSQYRVDGVRGHRHDYTAFLEAHVEQGPILEAAGKDIGIVAGIYGSCRLDVEITGEMAHAGTSPRRLRKDAFVSAVDMVSSLHRALHDEEDILRFTIGRFLAEPVSPSVVPNRVRFTIDLRHPVQGGLDSAYARAVEICSTVTGPCQSTVREIIKVPCVALDADLQARMRKAADRLCLSVYEIVSGAGHDARNLAPLYPTAMLFVPSKGGISHHPAEYTSPEQLAKGAMVLTDVIADLAQR